MKNEMRQFIDYNRPCRDSDSRMGPRRLFGDCSARNRTGFSLIEIIVAVSIVATLVLVSLPAIKAIQGSDDSTGTLSMIEAMLHTARSKAISNNAYVGVRFQKEANFDADVDAEISDNPLARNQYMILVLYKGKDIGTDGDVFIAMPGRKPIKLPENVGVTDMFLGDAAIINDSLTDTGLNNSVADMTTFTIVFSPNGKLVQRDAQMRNKEGEPDSTGSDLDDVFNNADHIRNEDKGQFLQDGTEEMSRRSFVIYSRDEFKVAYKASRPYTDYLQGLEENEKKFINLYTGEVIKD